MKLFAGTALAALVALAATAQISQAVARSLTRQL